MATETETVPASPPHKKARTGVGSSVANVTPGDTDQMVLALAKIKVERLLPRGRQVITTTTSETLPVVFKKLVDANILSLPVINLKGKYYGVIEMFDLVEYVINLLSNVGSTRFVDLEKMLQSESQFVSATVRDVIKRPLSKRNPFQPIEKGFSLFTAWEILALSGIYRIPVINELGDVVDYITQSMLIDFLWQNIEKIGPLAERKVSDIQSRQLDTVASVAASAKAITAFKEMVKTDNAGLAVLDDDGKIVDNISIRDLRGIHTDATVFWRLWSSVDEYKKKLRQEFPDKTPAELVYTLPNDTLFTVVEKMAKLHIHRIYVIETVQQLKPLRVITQADVLREVLGK